MTIPQMKRLHIRIRAADILLNETIVNVIDDDMSQPDADAQVEQIVKNLLKALQTAQ